jgi:excisionase family DNA binding protein
MIGGVITNMTSEEILDVKEVASMLKVSTRTVIRLAERGDLVAFKIGDLWRFRRSDVNEYIQQQIQRRQRDEQD